MNKEQAEKKLNINFGLESFYDEQWNVIEKILKGEKVLLIHKTGFGKSLCYQFPATLFDGITVVFSPLIALMRDQVSYLKSLGIKAECINSGQDDSENNRIIDEALKNKIKILYIAPERRDNIKWLESVRELNLKMIVIDEAHCISAWGHDFRPAFKRIIDLVKLLPASFPVLAVTATATHKVEEDIKSQLDSADISCIRGSLLRDNFKIRVIRVYGEEDKFGGILKLVEKLPGTGFIYTGTRVNTEIYANFLISRGINAIAYNAGLTDELRRDIESKLMNNEYKCIVSTNALGMGIDKKDIRFIIHTQFPQSPIHYYQEIGRAGRDGNDTYIFLFYHSSDRDLPEYFINNARPSKDKYEKIIDIIKSSSEPPDTKKLIIESDLTKTQLEVIKAGLIEQGIIKEVLYGSKKRYEYQFNAPNLDFLLFDKFKKHRLEELDRMIEYMESTTCRMKYLRNYLGDRTDIVCGKCDNCLKRNTPIWKNPPKIEKELENFHDNNFPELNIAVKKFKLSNGIAASYYGFSDTGAVIHKCKYENGGYFPDSLLKLTLRAYKKAFKNIIFDIILFIPPTESKDLVENFAERISVILKIPISYNLYKIKNSKPQKIFQNNINKKENVKDVYDYRKPCEIKNKKILLIDDVFDSGATIKEIAKILSRHEISKITPLVIARTIGGSFNNKADSDTYTNKNPDLPETNIKINENIKNKSYTVKEERKSNANAYKPWTDKDDRKLVELYNNDFSIKDLSDYFKRNGGSIRSRLNKLLK